MSSSLPANETMLGYGPGSAERIALKQELDRQAAAAIDIPLVINGQPAQGISTSRASMPHRRAHVLATVANAGPEQVQHAVDSASHAAAEWARSSFEARAAVFKRAAELAAGPWRQRLNAATMLGQSKTVHQAEIDSACELVDFLRFNVAFAEQIRDLAPISDRGAWNRWDARALDGFVYAATPFNFTAIGANLAIAPAIMGNTIIWKPSAGAILSNYLFMCLLMEAGLPAGVINFIPGDPEAITEQLLNDERLAGLHFTGSTQVFDRLWARIGARISQYRSYPRIVGETGGKNFVLAHRSADLDALGTALIRGAFEYQGQKCSAASRAYIPASLWPALKARLLEQAATLRVGDVADFRVFMGAVIDQRAFLRIRKYIETGLAEGSTLLSGGQADDKEGYFIQPTIFQVKDMGSPLMREEIFGPVLSVFVYPDEQWHDIMLRIDAGSGYALTGAVFAQDTKALSEAAMALRQAAGNIYLNDKPTGAVVGQQPFGGGRRSGTNDKAGSIFNMMRWTSPRVIKETFVPARDYRYPSMLES